MARTLIWNISATAQTLPAGYGGGSVQPGYGWIVADESSVAVTAMGGFEAMHGKWAVSAISTDEALGSVDMSAAGVALIADVSATIGGGGGGGGGPVTWASVTGKPSFATVATSGAYADLSGKPALADVATSGLYSDLSGTPAIPSASNDVATAVSATGAAGVLGTFARADHQHAHGNQAGGSLHSTATTMAAGFLSAADKSKLDGLATVATSGSYSDLSDKPTLATVAATGAYADLSGAPSLSAVATSGAYADLTGKPGNASTSAAGFMSAADKTSLDSLVSDATSGVGVFASPVISLAGMTGDYNDLVNKPSLATVATSGSYADLSNKPSKTYDIASYAGGSLALNATVAQVIAPKALTLTALTQTGGATVAVKVDGVAVASFPKSVTSGQVISVVVSAAGTNATFTISAVEA